MSYNKRTYTNTKERITYQDMNRIETGIEANDKAISGLHECATTGDADTIDGKHASDFVQYKKDMTYEELNNPSYGICYRAVTNLGQQFGLVNEWFYVEYYQHYNKQGYGLQLWYPFNNLNQNEPNYFRRANGAEWGNFIKIYDATNKPTPTEIGAALIQHDHDRVNGVKFYPGQPLQSNGNAQWFYGFNGGSDGECYVVPFSTFAPWTHYHSQYPDINANYIARQYISGNSVDINDANKKEFYATCVNSNASAPSADWWHIINIPHGDNNGYGGQLAIGYHGNAGLQVRSAAGNSWGPWYDIIGEIEKLKQRIAP